LPGRRMISKLKRKIVSAVRTSALVLLTGTYHSPRVGRALVIGDKPQ